jgi:hypothetical protein
MGDKRLWLMTPPPAYAPSQALQRAPARLAACGQTLAIRGLRKGEEMLSRYIFFQSPACS